MKKAVEFLIIMMVIVVFCTAVFLGNQMHRKRVIKQQKESVVREKIEQEHRAFECKIDDSIQKEAIGDSGLVVENYGHSVYYFNYTGKWFGHALASFKSAHTNLAEVAIAGWVEKRNAFGSDSRSNYGITTGYFVTFREK